MLIGIVRPQVQAARFQFGGPPRGTTLTIRFHTEFSRCQTATYPTSTTVPSATRRKGLFSWVYRPRPVHVCGTSTRRPSPSGGAVSRVGANWCYGAVGGGPTASRKLAAVARRCGGGLRHAGGAGGGRAEQCLPSAAALGARERRWIRDAGSGIRVQRARDNAIPYSLPLGGRCRPAKH